MNVYADRALEIVRQYVVDQLDKTDPIPEFEVYVVWFCKTLQNWKTLVGTSLPDLKYYEVTYNGDRGQVYLDVYLKVYNTCYVGST